MATDETSTMPTEATIPTSKDATDVRIESMGDDQSLPSSSNRDEAATAAIARAQLLNQHNVLQNSNLQIPNSHSTSNVNALQPQSQNSSSSPLLPGTPIVSPASGDTTPHEHGANQLRIQTTVNSTQLPQVPPATLSARATKIPPALSLEGYDSSESNLRALARTSSIKNPAVAHALGGSSNAITSANSSVVSSPVLATMGQVTPLPSPMVTGDSPGPWRRAPARPGSRESLYQPKAPDSVLMTTSGESIASALSSQSQRKSYAGLTQGGEGAKKARRDGMPGHERDRSISEYIPDALSMPKRATAVSGSYTSTADGSPMRREPNLAGPRGLTPVEKPPSPPPSESSATGHDVTPPLTTTAQPLPQHDVEYFEAKDRKSKSPKRWRAIRQLGEGTFSRVMLATSDLSAPAREEYGAPQQDPQSRLLTPEPTSSQYNPKSLVAIKVCEHGPKGGASETRVEMSLKRELDIMQSIHHPSVVDLQAWTIESRRAILVLGFCPGGDLFDMATSESMNITPPLLQRIFAELVGAVSYLHERHIVHRDIKLENVLVNLSHAELSNPNTDWQTYPYSITTLTDLGLSRRVADDEMLETRCGSDDYAAPEVIMGQPYNGYSTDAWSLGVLLYALLESRLPFDPLPGSNDFARQRIRTSHRIARVEWRWIAFAGDDGDREADTAKFEEMGLVGAMEVTEGLLRRARSRLSLGKVGENQWVKRGICVDGGICFREVDAGTRHGGEEEEEEA